MKVVRTGQKVIHKDGTQYWTVTAFTIDLVSLTGPGICRSMKYVDMDDLLTHWREYKEPT